MNTTKDYLKLLNAGFTILRIQNEPTPRIKYLRNNNADGKNYVSSADWCLLEKFDTKAARDRRMNELLEDDKTVEG